MDKVQKEFEQRALRYSNIWMYFNQTTIEVINFCRTENIPVFGLEAFRLSGKGIQPSIEHSVWFENKNACWNQALEFVRQDENKEFLYEVWYEGY